MISMTMHSSPHPTALQLPISWGPTCITAPVLQTADTPGYLWTQASMTALTTTALPALTGVESPCRKHSQIT